MKQFRLLLLISILSLPFVKIRAEYVTVDSIIYYYGDYDLYACVSGFVDGVKHVIIVDSIDGRAVDRINYRAFNGCKTLETITISNSVTSVRAGAFEKCTNLRSVSFLNSKTEIDYQAFYGCSSLTSITLPDSITILEEAIFWNCSSLKSITIPSCVTEICSYAFSDCSSLTSITLPDSITILANGIFRNCSSLKSIIIPASVTEIGSSAFYGCNNLSSIDIPDNVKTIGNDAFRNCTNLTSVVIPDGITSLSEGLFRDCLSLNSILLPESVKTIGSMCFYGCNHLSSMVLPDGVNDIGDYAFYNCSSLASIIIPNGVKKINNYVFDGCKNLKTVSLGDSITEIRSQGFHNCNSLVSIDIPESVTYIGPGAFMYCYSLKTIVIPDSVTYVGADAFYECKNLSSVTLQSGLVPMIGACAFWTSGVKLFVLKGREILKVENFTYITNRFSDIVLFVEDGLYEEYVLDPEWKKISKRIYSADMMTLRTVEVVADESRSAIFEELKDSAKFVANLKVKGSINGYDIMALRNKSSHLLYLDLSEADIVANDGGYEYYSGCQIESDNELGDRCFYETNLMSIKLPKSLKRIGEYAFSNCIYLESVECNDGLEYIENCAFRNCSNLKSINLPNSLVSIGTYTAPYYSNYDYVSDGVFQNCTSLGPKLVIPEKITDIYGNTFKDCTSLDSVYIGKSVNEIHYASFYGCNNLRYVSFNRGLKVVGHRAFENCFSLSELSLPYSVTTIEDNAFEDCRSLKEIRIPSMTKSIGYSSFYGCDDVDNIYVYTVEPITIKQSAFSFKSSTCLNVPKTSVDLYVYNTQWSQFETVHEFDEPYDAFYLNGDYELNDNTGRLDGEPDAELNATSGFIVQGDEAQVLNEIELVHDGTNGATIIGGADDLTGNQVNLTAKIMKVNISVDGNRWYFFCFPFDVEHDSIECTADYMFYSYDGNRRAGTGAGWVQVEENFKTLNKGVGYVFQTGRSGILTIHVNSNYLSFTANNQKETLNAYSSENVSDASWNFMGNPFISYYDVQDLAKEYDAPIVVWNGYGYDAYKPGDDDYQLKPFEAFFVQKESGSSYVEFLPENRITYNQAAERSSLRAKKRTELGTPITLDRQLVNIVLMSQDSISDRTRIVYSTKAGMDYEIGVDASKFHTDGIPEIYTVNGTTKYAINERPMGTDDIKLGYIAPKAGTYTLSVPRHDAEIEIYDNDTHQTVDFTFGDYQFTSKAGTYNDRFVIHKTSGGVTAVENGFRLDGMTVTAFDGGIDIEGQFKGKVQIYSESGMLMAEPKQSGRVQLDGGVYIIKVGDRSIKLNVNRGGYAL